MYTLTQKYVSQLYIASILLILSSVCLAHETGATDPAMRASQAELDHVIKQKLDYYNKRYPQVYFIQLDGGNDWQDEFQRTIDSIGTAPVALDYQHPPELRKMLMDVTLQRLSYMLETDTVSATLFRVGQNSRYSRENLCVITLNPEEYVTSDYQVTRYMLNMDNATMKQVHPARHLDLIHHLQFTIDHEAFHCLDSFLHGGAPQTHEEWGGEYNMFRRESISDAYAMVMHIREHGDVTPFARNLLHIRAICLYANSPHCCTFETLRAVIQYDDEVLRSVEINDVIELVTHLRDRAIGSYRNFIAHHAASVEVARRIGINVAGYEQQADKLKANPALVKFMLNRYRFYYAKLFEDGQVPLEAPHEHEWAK